MIHQHGSHSNLQGDFSLWVWRISCWPGRPTGYLWYKSAWTHESRSSPEKELGFGRHCCHWIYPLPELVPSFLPMPCTNLPGPLDIWNLLTHKQVACHLRGQPAHTLCCIVFCNSWKVPCTTRKPVPAVLGTNRIKDFDLGCLFYDYKCLKLKSLVWMGLFNCISFQNRSKTVHAHPCLRNYRLASGISIRNTCCFTIIFSFTCTVYPDFLPPEFKVV